MLGAMVHRWWHAALHRWVLHAVVHRSVLHAMVQSHHKHHMCRGTPMRDPFHAGEEEYYSIHTKSKQALSLQQLLDRQTRDTPTHWLPLWE